MEYTTLGKTGLTISRMGFGGIPIQKVDVPTVRTLMQALADSGVNYIDTARGYTVSESYLGEALEGMRDRFVIATKSMARTKEAMEKDIETSLANLRTDHIELYQVHNPSLADLETVIAPGGALEALLEAKDAGKIGHIGLTAHMATVFERALGMDWVETIMFPYNIVETQGEALMRRCTEQGVGFIVMKPLAGGALEDATLALRFIGQNPDVSVVIPGMYSTEEVKQNLAAMEDNSPLTQQELEQIETIRRELGTQFCRAPQASASAASSCWRAICSATAWATGRRRAMRAWRRRRATASAAACARRAARISCPSARCWRAARRNSERKA